MDPAGIANRELPDGQRCTETGPPWPPAPHSQDPTASCTWPASRPGTHRSHAMPSHLGACARAVLHHRSAPHGIHLGNPSLRIQLCHRPLHRGPVPPPPHSQQSLHLFPFQARASPAALPVASLVPFSHWVFSLDWELLKERIRWVHLRNPSSRSAVSVTCPQRNRQMAF